MKIIISVRIVVEKCNETLCKSHSLFSLQFTVLNSDLEFMYLCDLQVTLR